ncbi:unnamed protein product [Rhodiola kirilowii]|jgi:hypothetical protein
MQNG